MGSVALTSVRQAADATCQPDSTRSVSLAESPFLRDTHPWTLPCRFRAEKEVGRLFLVAGRDCSVCVGGGRLLSPHEADDASADMQAVAEKHGLDKKTAFSHEAKRAVFSQESATWSVEVQDVSKDEKGALPAARTLTCRVLISGMGALSVPRSCGVKGAETFQGPLFHSARWDHSADLTDKNVVILGTLCRAMQLRRPSAHSRPCQATAARHRKSSPASHQRSSS